MKFNNYSLIAILIAFLCFSACNKEDLLEPTAKRLKKTVVLMGEEEDGSWGDGGGQPYRTRTQIGPTTPITYVNVNGTINYAYNPDVYNCHSYVWGPPSVNDAGYIAELPNWNNNPLNHTQGYHEISFSDPNQVGDRVIYYQVNSVTGAIEATHSAKVTKVDAIGNCTEVTSKWGEGALYTHDPRDVPMGYSSPAPTFTYGAGATHPSRVYYRKN